MHKCLNQHNASSLTILRHLMKKLLSFLIFATMVACKGNDIVDPPITETISAEDATATTNMRARYGSMSQSLNSLISATHHSEHLHWDSLYHHHDSLFWHHHNQFHHDTYTHDDHHHTWVPHHHATTSHHYHHVYPGHPHDSLVTTHNAHSHNNNDRHYTGHDWHDHHVLDSLHHVHAAHHP